LQEEPGLIFLPRDGLTICTYVHIIFMKYKWDPKKAGQNLLKHGVHFSELEPVFEDERALSIDEVVGDEERMVLIGMDGLARVLVVVYTLHGDAIRIISARKAGPEERRSYGIR
jgi:uncharacterized DUF497 family protein